VVSSFLKSWCLFLIGPYQPRGPFDWSLCSSLSKLPFTSSDMLRIEITVGLVGYSFSSFPLLSLLDTSVRVLGLKNPSYSVDPSPPTSADLKIIALPSRSQTSLLLSCSATVSTLRLSCGSLVQGPSPLCAFSTSTQSLCYEIRYPLRLT